MLKTVIATAAVIFFPALARADVTSSVSNGVLTVAADDSGNTITIGCSGEGGNVMVNSTDPSSGAVTCSSISGITVNGGNGGDSIDLSGVMRSEFAAAIVININGGDGDDHITGSPFNDTITGGGGNNWIDAGTGDDTINFDGGNDLAYGNLGDDTFNITTASGGRYLDGGTGNDTVNFSASDNDDTVDIEVLPPDPLMQNEVDTYVIINGVQMSTAFLENYNLSLGQGNDTVTAQIPPNGAVNITDGSGTNTLTYDAQCQSGALTDSSFTISGFPASDFSGFSAAPTVINSFDFQVGEVDVAADATSATAQLNTGDACAWTATSDSDWLTVDSVTGTGSAQIPLTLTANTAADARTGHLTVNGASVAVVQAGTSGSTTTTGSTSGGSGSTGTTSTGTKTTSTTPAATTTSTPAKKGCAATQPSEFFALAFAALVVIRRSRRPR